MPLMSILTIEQQLKPIVDAVPCTEIYVINAEYLMQKLKQKKGDAYCKIAKAYADISIKNYGLKTVVIDAYDAGISTKENTPKKKHETKILQYFISPVILNWKGTRKNSFHWDNKQ